MDQHGNRYLNWHQTFLPPQYRVPNIQTPSACPFLNRTQPKYPHLNPALAADTTSIRYDLRKTTRDGMPSSMYQQIAPQYAFAQPTQEVRIISKAFPWSLDICAPTGSTITCANIFEGLYKTLQESIGDSEWGIVVVHDKPQKEVVEKAAKARHGKDKEKDLRLKRIDWLGETTAFKGLERAEEFEKKRLLPGKKAWKETWVVKFGKP